MPRLPYHKYVGPGNELNNGEPTDSDDHIAYDHDHAYANAERAEDIHAADSRAISDFVGAFQDGNHHALLGAAGLAIKTGVERASGRIIYGMPKEVPKHKYIGKDILGVRYQPHFDQEDENRPRSPIQRTPPQQQEINHQVHQIEKAHKAKLHGPEVGESSSGPSEPKKPKINILENKKLKSPNIRDFFKNYKPEDTPTSDSTPKQIGIAKPMYNQLIGHGGVANAGTPMDVGGSERVNRSGSGPGMGAMGASAGSAPTILNCKPGEGTPFRHVYRKSYRFLTPTSLTSIRKHVNTAPSGDNPKLINGSGEIIFTIGSSAIVELARIGYHMSPWEYHEIYRNFASFKIESISGTVHALGVRAPYTTGESNIEVANSNLQCPVMDITPLQEHYRVQPDVEYWTNSLLKKLNGSRLVPEDRHFEEKDKTTEFEGMSARMETRLFKSRCKLYMPVPLVVASDDDDTPTVPEGFEHSYPDLLNHCEKMINGSNHLGVAFHKTYNIDRTYWKRSTTAFDGTHLISEHVPVDDHSHYTGGSTLFSLKDWTGVGLDAKGREDIVQESGIVPYNLATVWGTIMRDDVKPKPPTHLIFAIYNIRNITSDVAEDTTDPVYNKIVDLNFEWVLTTELVATGHMMVPIYYNPTPYPTPMWFSPRFTAGAEDRPHMLFHQPTATYKDRVYYSETVPTTGEYRNIEEHD